MWSKFSRIHIPSHDFSTVELLMGEPGMIETYSPYLGVGKTYAGVSYVQHQLPKTHWLETKNERCPWLKTLTSDPLRNQEDQKKLECHQVLLQVSAGAIRGSCSTGRAVSWNMLALNLVFCMKLGTFLSTPLLL